MPPEPIPLLSILLFMPNKIFDCIYSFLICFDYLISPAILNRNKTAYYAWKTYANSCCC
jgi:hypothetical protein